MFKKIGDGDATSAPAAPPPRRIPAPGGAGTGMIWLDPAIGEGRAQPTLTITGSVSGEADIAINTRIKGDVTVNRLTLDEGGVIEGTITAEQVEVRGRVKGDIKAQSVRLTARAVVEGDITAAKLAIDLGADFQGVVKRMAVPAPPPLVEAAPPAPQPLSAKAALEAIATDLARTPTMSVTPDGALVN